jgi:hypothetical protein
VVTVPDPTLILLAAAIFVPPLTSLIIKRQRLAVRLMSLGISVLLVLGILANEVVPATAAPDVFYLHDSAKSGVTPAGKQMNNTEGAGASTLLFNSSGQNAYWYSELSYPEGVDDASIAAGTYTGNLYFSSLPSGPSAPAVSGSVSTGDARPRTLTISHTTSGSDRLMMVGVSILNSGSETVSGVTYNGGALTRLSNVQTGSHGRVEIWYRKAPDGGTHDVVVTFDDGAGGGLRSSAVVGVMTFTGVHQTTTFGTAATNFDNATPFGTPTVNVTSATNELVFDTVVCEVCTSLSVGAGQTQRWNLTETSGSPTVIGAGSTEPGAATVTMSWTQGAGNYWAIAAAPIKPSGGSAPAIDSISTGQTQRTSMTISHTTPVAGTNRLMLVGVALNPSQSETVSSITYNGASLSLVGSAQQASDTRVEIWSLVAPDTGTHDVVITFSANLLYGAKAGVITFTGVNQSTPLGTYAAAAGNSTGPATVDVSSATNELVFDTVGCQGNATPTLCASLSVGSGQSQRWNLTANDAGTAGEQTRSGASTEPGAASVTMSWTISTAGDVPWAIAAVPIKPVTPSVDITVYAQHTATDGSSATTITSASTSITSSTSDPLALNLGSGSQQTFTSGNLRLLRMWIEVTAVSGGGSFTLAYDSAADPASLDTPVVTVPEWGAAFVLLVPLIPYLMTYIWKRRRLAGQLASVLLAAIMALGTLAGTVEEVSAAPDTHYLHPTATSGITPAGEYMNITAGSGGSSKAFNTAGQNAYWYVDATWPTGNGDASIAAGNYTLNMYFANRPGAGSGDYPAVANTATSVNNSNGTSHTVSLPSGVQSGELLIVIFGFRGGTGQTITWPSGYTSFFRSDRLTNVGVEAAWRKADGGEGSTITVQTSANARTSHNSYRITGAADPTTRPPESAASNGNNTNPDPPSLTPTGGAKDYLWIAVEINSDGTTTITGWPGSYTGGIQANGTGTNTTTGSTVRQLYAASEDPGAFTISSSIAWAAGTLVVHPAAAVNIQVTVSHTASDGSGATTIVQSSTTKIDSNTSDPYALSIGSGSAQTFTAASPRRMRVQVNVTSTANAGDFTLDYDGACGSGLCSNLDTPVVVVPDPALALIPVGLLLPILGGRLTRRRRLDALAIGSQAGGRPASPPTALPTAPCCLNPLPAALRIAKGGSDLVRPINHSTRHSSCNSDRCKGA